MKRIFGTAALLLALTACGNQNVDPINVVEPTQSATTDGAGERAYLIGVRQADDSGYASALPDDDLIALGKEVCGAMRDNGFDETIETMIDAADNEDEAYFYGSVAGAAVVAFCPEFEDQANDFTGQAGI